MKELKDRLNRAKRFKFLRNIIIVLVSLAIVAAIVNIAPGYKRDKYKDVINLIIDEENKTEELTHEIYVNENGTVYISQDDVKKLFDDTIIYDEKYNQIITTGQTKLAYIGLNEKYMIVNETKQIMLDSIVKNNDTIYIPISDMALVYNISVKYSPNTKRVVIENLNKGIIRAIVTEETEIKFKPRKLSKNIGTLQKGETVYGFYTTSKGWRKIRTQDGILGYIKANRLTGEYILRQDMEERKEAFVISKEQYKNKLIEIEDKKIKVLNNTLQNEEQENDNIKVWGVATNRIIENEINTIIGDSNKRKELIESIVKQGAQNNLNGIIVDFYKTSNKDDLKRFIIELTPRLREIGVNTCIVLNNELEKEDYKNIVDYIVE